MQFKNHRKIFCHTVTKSSRSLICADKLNAVSVLVSLFKLSFANEGFTWAESFISLINPAISSSGSISCGSPTTSISIDWLSIIGTCRAVSFSSSNYKNKFIYRIIHRIYSGIICLSNHRDIQLIIMYLHRFKFARRRQVHMKDTVRIENNRHRFVTLYIRPYRSACFEQNLMLVLLWSAME